MLQLTTLLPLALWAAGSEASFASVPASWKNARHITSDNHVAERNVAITAPLVLRPITSQRNSNMKSSESVEDMANRLAEALIIKYSASAGASDSPNRDNNFNVVPAQTPNGQFSGGVLQDGSDTTYFIDAKLGSKQKSLYMLLDTGASTTWVMGEGCQSEACGIHDSFGPDDSSSYTDTGVEFSVNYGSGSVTGHMIKDKMSIANLEVPMEFGVANVTSNDFKQFPFDGILGLSMNTKSFLTALKDSGLVQSNVFGVSLARASDGVNDGEIAFGGPNPDKYTGDISYTKVGSGGSWVIPMDDVVVNGSPSGVSGLNAYIDTGTSYGFAPPSAIEAIFSQIPGAKPTTSEKVVWSIPCDAKADVAIKFSGQSWTISAKDLVINSGSGSCEGRLFGREVVKGAFLLGDVFLKNVYSVFDMDQSRIGFAAKSNKPTATTSGAETQPASTSTATSATSTSGTSPAAPTTTAVTTTSVSSSNIGLGLVSSPTSTDETPAADALLTTSTPTPTPTPGAAIRLGCGSRLASVVAVLSFVAMIV
ncbi:aspartic peptidase domain-containing protein [Microdochium trichocladiopsis]|uniref:Aspartic peptidase domain-containing protein n=1 Tax=Microdochium trichocladiopsis TaxID=1682393 RepID=A0A9P8YIB7_9PEZI|nr:aspartic peptidase domain-containing protein [Microdochium trichocladiopsis]KAH7040473.1 aspartic peptidase domain-containing protein [Microdochium trichocladiopsis]